MIKFFELVVFGLFTSYKYFFMEETPTKTGRTIIRLNWLYHLPFRSCFKKIKYTLTEQKIQVLKYDYFKKTKALTVKSFLGEHEIVFIQFTAFHLVKSNGSRTCLLFMYIHDRVRITHVHL